MSGLTWKRCLAILTPFVTAPHPCPPLAAALIGVLGTHDLDTARAAVAALADLVYAEDARTRAAGLRALARVALRYPVALGAPAWRWRVQVAAAAADPGLAPITRQLLVLCPAPVRRVSPGEAALWAELAVPVALDYAA
jgi:hypothetical protein